MQKLKEKLRSLVWILLVAIVVADLAFGALMRKPASRSNVSESKNEISMEENQLSAERVRMIEMLHYLIEEEGLTPEAASAIAGNIFIAGGFKEEWTFESENSITPTIKPVSLKRSVLSADAKAEAEKQNQATEASMLVIEFAKLVEKGYEPDAAMALVAQLWVSGELLRQPNPELSLLGEEEGPKSEANNSSEENGAVRVPEAKAVVMIAEAKKEEEEKKKEPEVPVRTAPPKTVEAGRQGEITKNSTTAERIWWIFEFLIEEGFTPESAAAVIGNVAVESAFNPSVVSSMGYYGLFQWNTSSGGGYWWYDIQDWMTANGYEWDSFEGQMKAFLNCSNRGFLTDSRLDTLKSLTNVEQAVEMIAVFYEGCVGGTEVTEYYNRGNYYQGLSTRKSEAWVAYYMYCDRSWDYNGQKPYYS